MKIYENNRKKVINKLSTVKARKPFILKEKSG